MQKASTDISIDINIYVMSNNEAIKSFTVEKNDQIKSYWPGKNVRKLIDQNVFWSLE